VWILFLNTDGTVKSHRKISSTRGGFTGPLHDWALFGYSLTGLGDLDGDDTADLAVGASNDRGGGGGRGAVWVLFLNRDGTVKSHLRIGDSAGGFTGTLDNADHFGCSVASLGDLDGDGPRDLAVGAYLDDDGGPDRGAVWVLFLDGAPCDPCDMNCDGDINALDIEPFLALLFGGGVPCDTCTGDVTGNGVINRFDIEPFLWCLFP
jgi:hypothetical protein